MFLNNLFVINDLVSDPENIRALIRIDCNHMIFNGHFPGSPVVPGVVQLQIVKEIVEFHLQKKLAMQSMKTCKFLNILNPVKTPEIELLIKFKKSDFLEVIASGAFDDNVFFKAQISYK